MNFFEQQDKARSKTTRLVIMFLIGIIALGIIAFMAIFIGYIFILEDGYNVEEEAFTVASFFTVVLVIVLLLATWIKIAQLRRGGGPQVAKELGGILLEESNLDKIEGVSQHQIKVLMNINKEMALASGVPVPNLEETAKGYMKHEKETLKMFIDARNSANDAAKAASSNQSDQNAIKDLQAS